MHTLANGTVVDRSLQYVIIDQPSGSQWRGTLIRNLSMTMIGEVMRLKSNWQPTYNEWLYQDGQLVMHSMALCEDKPVTATQSNTTVAAPAPAQSAPQTGKQTVKRIPLRLSGNNYIVPVLINGRIWLDFMLDTGASDVTIPDDVATNSDTRRDYHEGEEKNYVLADGGTVGSPHSAFIPYKSAKAIMPSSRRTLPVASVGRKDRSCWGIVSAAVPLDNHRPREFGADY